MQSDNYAIEKDSINFGGTDDSESASYKLSDTMGEVGAGEMSERCYSMSFDGTNDSVGIVDSASLNITGAITISAWVKPTTNTQTNAPEIIAKGGSADSYRIRMDASGGLVGSRLYGTTNPRIYTTSALSTESFSLITFTYDGSFNSAYKDGVLESRGANSGSISVVSANLYLGSIGGFGEYFSGLLDDVRIYNRALSETEVLDLYKGNQIGNTGLVGYWGFDEGSGTTIADLSGNGNTGTISGATFSSDTPLATCSVLSAGYREMLPSYISMTDPADVVLSPDIGGVSGGTGDGSATWNVKTDSPAGYQVSVRAGTFPALKSGSDSFADYTPMTTGTPDFTWNIASTDSEFGYTVEGDNAIGKFLDNGGGTCGVGSGNVADKCWFPFSTADSSIVNASSSNHPLGSDTTVKFKAQSGSGHLQPEGVYTATIVVTAVAL